MGGRLKKAVWIGTALLLIGLAEATAQMPAGAMRGPGMMGPAMMSPVFGMPGQSGELTGYDPVERMRAALNLGDNQVAQLRNLWLEYLRAAAQGQADLLIAQAELQVLLQAGRNANPGQVENQIRRISSLQTTLQAAWSRYQQQERDLLTPQQSNRLGYYQQLGIHGEAFGSGGFGNLPMAGFRKELDR